MAAKESSEPINVPVISAIDNKDISKWEIAYLKGERKISSII